MHTSLLLCSSVLRKTPREKVTAPPIEATQESSQRAWASFTLFWKENFIFISTMATVDQRPERWDWGGGES